MRQSEFYSHKVDTPPIMTVASDGSINIPVPVTPLNAAHTSMKSLASDNSIHSTPDSQLAAALSTPQSINQNSLHQNILQGFLNSNTAPNQPVTAQNQVMQNIQQMTQNNANQSKQPRALMGSGMMNFQQQQAALALAQAQAQTQAQAQSLALAQAQSLAQAQTSAQAAAFASTHATSMAPAAGVGMPQHAASAQMHTGRPIVKGRLYS